MKQTTQSFQLSSTETEQVGIAQLELPFALYRKGKLVVANQSYHNLFRKSPELAQTLLTHSRLTQAIQESDDMKARLTLDVEIEECVFHCIVSPVADKPHEVGVIFEDVSTSFQRDRDNALLYRLSLLFANLDQPLTQTLQMIVDRILFDVEAFDCSILLFNKQEGQLHMVAWGKSDNTSSMNGEKRFALGEGIAGLAAASKKPIIIPNILQDPRFVRKPSDLHPMALLCVPIVFSRELQGVISVARKTYRGFSDREVQLFTIIAGRLSTLIKSAEDKEREADFHELSQILSVARNIFDEYPRVISILSSIFAVDDCAIARCDTNGGLSFIRPESEIGLTKRQLTVLRRISKQNYFRKMLLARRPVELISVVPHSVKEELEAVKLCGAAIFPITVRNQSYGFILVNNTAWQRIYNQAELNLGGSIAIQLAVAIENTLYHGEVLDERKKLQQIQDTLPEALILYAPDTTVVMYNTAAKRMLGFKKNVVGLTWSEVLNSNAEKYCSHLLERHFDPTAFLDQALNHGKTSIGLATLSGRQLKTIEVTVAPVYDRYGKISGILSHLRDITPIHDLQTKMAIRLKQLTNLFKISSVTGFNVQQLVRRILDIVIRLVSVKACQLVLVTPQTNELYVVESAGDKELLEKINPMLLRKIKRTIHTCKPQITRITYGNNQASQALIVPILGHHDSCIGTLIVIDKTGESAQFNKDDSHLLAIVAARIAAKLDTAWLLTQVEEDREKLAAIIEQSVDGIMVTDPNQEIQIWNTAMEKLTGATEEQIKGKTIDQIRNIFPDMEVHQHEDFTELRIKNIKTGRQVWLGAGYSPILANKEVTGYVVILRDISRQKELEIAKNEFVSTASHELRSPITAIVGYLSMLRRGDAGALTNPQQAFFVDKAYNNAKRMVGLVEDLLTTTRMETGQARYTIEPLDLQAQMETIVADLRFKAEEKHIEVTLHRTAHPMVLADHDGVVQVFTNIVNNAIKYTPAQGKVNIHFKHIDQDGKPMLQVSVADTGVGIDLPDQERIFDKFTRIDNPLSVSAGGTGLGLYITKTIVEQLGGKIWLESIKGKGSTFYINLPAAVEAGKERNI